MLLLQYITKANSPQYAYATTKICICNSTKLVCMYATWKCPIPATFYNLVRITSTLRGQHAERHRSKSAMCNMCSPAACLLAGSVYLGYLHPVTALWQPTPATALGGNLASAENLAGQLQQLHAQPHAWIHTHCMTEQMLKHHYGARGKSNGSSTQPAKQLRPAAGQLRQVLIKTISEDKTQHTAT